jgi:hypothetical protein
MSEVRVEGILNFVKPWSMGYIHDVKTNIEGCLNFFIYIYVKEPNLAKSSYG